MHRRIAAAAVTVPIAGAGLLAAHAAAYAWATPDPVERHALLEATGHGYLHVAWSAVLALCGLLAVASLSTRGRGGIRAAISPRLVAAVAPAAFLVQEHLERISHDGAFPAGLLLDPTVMLGLALQVPFALAAFLVARCLLRVVDRVAAVLRGCGPRWRGHPRTVRIAAGPVRVGASAPAGPATGRGPPRLAHAGAAAGA